MDLAKLVQDAPPGEIEAIRQDIEVFTEGDAAVKRAIAQQLAMANVSRMRVVTVNSQTVLLTPFNQLGPSEFWTPGPEPLKFHVDHTTLAVSDVEPFDGVSAEAAAHAARLQTRLKEYGEDHFPTEFLANVFASTENGGRGDANVVIVGRKLSPENFFNGQITGTYQVRGGGNKLLGEIKVDAHYFEEGNVRLQTNTKVDTTVRGDNGSINDAIVDAIKRAEDDFETKLNSTLVNLNQNEFKALRRQLPVTRAPMIWGKAVAGYRIGGELGERRPSAK